jgi:hypothetical protein
VTGPYIDYVLLKSQHVSVFRRYIILKETLQIIYIKIKNLNYLVHKFFMKIETTIMLKLIRVDCS